MLIDVLDLTILSSEPCYTKCTATLDVRDLLSGGREALKAINNVDTRFRPISFRLSGPGSSTTHTAIHPTTNNVFQFEPSVAMDARKGMSVPVWVSVPRNLWPRQRGETVQVTLRAEVTIEFVHSNHRVETVVRTAKAVFPIRLD